jgi:hypothetical protein
MTTTPTVSDPITPTVTLFRPACEDCHVGVARTPEGTSVHLTYCPAHAAAPELLAFARRVGRMDPEHIRAALAARAEARALVARIEGGRP